jgi:hypothetical protein
VDERNPVEELSCTVDDRVNPQVPTHPLRCVASQVGRGAHDTTGLGRGLAVIESSHGVNVKVATCSTPTDALLMQRMRREPKINVPD